MSLTESIGDPLTPGQPRAVEVVEGLRQLIVDGDLAPGQRIKQDAVAKRFGVSRLPVREAIRQLASEGLVTLEQGAGGRVALLDSKELLEIYRLREVIEPMMIARTAVRITDAELTETTQLQPAGEKCADANDIKGYLEYDREFHSQLLAISRMPRALSIVRNLWRTAERYRRTFTILPHRLEVSAVEHRMILEALARHAPDDAADLYRLHVRRTRLTLTEHVELFPDGARS